MIISASRRTDIPCYYSAWLLKRLQAGFVLTRNPFRATQIKRVSLLPEDVEALVFWTKDPQAMLSMLPLLDDRGLTYYFQFTVTPYNNTLERNLRDKAAIENTFVELSQTIGRDRVLWRYDPIILNEQLDTTWHLREFTRMCQRFAPYTNRVTISFVDIYSKLKSDLLREISEAEMTELAGSLAQIAAEYQLDIRACCEKLDLRPYGVQRAACIDKQLIERLKGKPVAAAPDKNQRPGCGCAQSVDIGTYNTCANGCVYCYANRSLESARRNLEKVTEGAEGLWSSGS